MGFNARTLGTVAVTVFFAAASAYSANDEQADDATRLRDAVCAACHGSAGISVAAHIPNLAGQKEAYLRASLKSFRDGSRKSDIMGTVARTLSDQQIDRLAAHFASLNQRPPAEAAVAARTSLPTQVSFPAGYPTGYTLYFTQFLADDGQVKRYFANDVAIAAVRRDAPLPDGAIIVVEVYAAIVDANGNARRDDGGQLLRGKLLAFPVMARIKGAGHQIPSVLRNEDWNYALFSPERALRPNMNHAECLACHKPQASNSFVFTFNDLSRAVR